MQSSKGSTINNGKPVACKISTRMSENTLTNKNKKKLQIESFFEKNENVRFLLIFLYQNKRRRSSRAI
jgi:hypothetical protein